MGAKRWEAAGPSKRIAKHQRGRDNSPAHRREAVPADPLGQHRRHARATAPVITGYQERGLSNPGVPHANQDQEPTSQSFSTPARSLLVLRCPDVAPRPGGAAGIPAKSASRLRCTAEHLQARCDGGRDEASNVVAACEHCNQTRHRLRPPPHPNAHLKGIRKQIAHGGWHPGWVRSSGLLSVGAVVGTRAKAPSSG